MSHCIVKLRVKRNIVNERSAVVAVGEKVYAFGGYNRNTRKPPLEDQINVYVLNTVSLRWTTLPPVTTTRGERPPEVPCSRYAQTAVLIDDIVYVWGGQNMDGLCKNVLYAFDVNTHRWLNSDVSGSVPAARRYHRACALGKVMYVHGGWSYSRTGPHNDIHKLDTTTMVWSLINTRGTVPPAFVSHSVTIIGTKMFVFGGSGAEVLNNNISVFDTETDCWLSPPSSARRRPNARWGHAAFAYNGELYIFGGDNCLGEEFNTSSDVWRFSPESFSWKEVIKPKVNDPLWMKNDCCCMVGNRVIVFRELRDDRTPNDDLYILDFSPSLKTLCKLAVIQYNLEQSELPHNVRWELAAMTDGELEDSA